MAPTLAALQRWLWCRLYSCTVTIGLRHDTTRLGSDQARQGEKGGVILIRFLLHDLSYENMRLERRRDCSDNPRTFKRDSVDVFSRQGSNLTITCVLFDNTHHTPCINNVVSKILSEIFSADFTMLLLSLKMTSSNWLQYHRRTTVCQKLNIAWKMFRDNNTCW